MSQPVDVVSVGIEYDTSRSLQQLRAAVDSSLRVITRDFDAAFDAIERGAADAGGDIGREVASGGEKAEGALREVERQAKTSLDRVSREANEAGLSLGKIGGIVKGIALSAGVATVTLGLGALAKMGLETAASLEQTEVAFSSLLGSAERGAQVLDDLKKFAALTPFELTDITGAAQRFLAFNDAVGIADSQLQPFLTTLGNIASVTAAGAEGVNRVTLALGQIASRGTVSLEDLQQIQEALPGFSSVAAIAAATGRTTAETLDAISSGSISATDGIAALLEGMDKFPGAAGAMEAQSQTLLGVFSTFQDTINQSLAGAFEPVIPVLKKVVEEVTPLLGEAFSTLAPEIGTVLVQGLAALTPAIKPLAGILAITLRALTPFIEILGQILTPIIEGLMPVFEALEPVIGQLSEPVQDLVVALLPLVPALSQILVAVVTVLAPLLQLVGIIVSFLSQKAIVPLVMVLAEVLGFLAEAVRQFGVWLTQVDWGSVLATIGQFFVDLWDDIAGFFSAIGDFLGKLPRMAAEAFSDFNSAVLTKIREFMGFINGIPKRIRDALANLGRLLIDKGKDLIRGLWDGIAAMGGWLWNKVSSFVYDNTVGAAKSILGIGSPSKVMADEVGQWVPAGAEVGIESGMGSLRSLINSMLTPPAAASGPAAGLAGAGITVVLNFNGPLPTVEQAQQLGEAAGNGVLKAVSQRDTRAAVRMAQGG